MNIASKIREAIRPHISRDSFVEVTADVRLSDLDLSTCTVTTETNHNEAWGQPFTEVNHFVDLENATLNGEPVQFHANDVPKVERHILEMRGKI